MPQEMNFVSFNFESERDRESGNNLDRIHEILFSAVILITPISQQLHRLDAVQQSSIAASCTIDIRLPASHSGPNFDQRSEFPSL